MGRFCVVLSCKCIKTRFRPGLCPGPAGELTTLHIGWGRSISFPLKAFCVVILRPLPYKQGCWLRLCLCRTLVETRKWQRTSMVWNYFIENVRYFKVSTRNSSASAALSSVRPLPSPLYKGNNWWLASSVAVQYSSRYSILWERESIVWDRLLCDFVSSALTHSVPSIL